MTCRDKPQSNDRYRALTALVQHSDYRASSHRRIVASSHTFNMEGEGEGEGGGVLVVLADLISPQELF
jgi:hypothetical protein